jgi:hypothetical protein
MMMICLGLESKLAHHLLSLLWSSRCPVFFVARPINLVNQYVSIVYAYPILQVTVYYIIRWVQAQ